MTTVKIIHYPEGGNRTTEIFESEDLLIEEGYLHELYTDSLDDFFDNKSPHKKFGGQMQKERASKYWAIKIFLDSGILIAGINSEVYVMVDGRTVASYKSFEID